MDFRKCWGDDIIQVLKNSGFTESGYYVIASYTSDSNEKPLYLKEGEFYAYRDRDKKYTGFSVALDKDCINIYIFPSTIKVYVYQRTIYFNKEYIIIDFYDIKDFEKYILLSIIKGSFYENSN